MFLIAFGGETTQCRSVLAKNLAFRGDRLRWTALSGYLEWAAGRKCGQPCFARELHEPEV